MTLSTRRVLEESVSIALILLVWALLSVLGTADGRLQFAIVLGGLVMAGLYAVVRGVALAADADPAYDRPDAERILRENGRAMLASAPWFVLALVAATVADDVFRLLVPVPQTMRLVRPSLEVLVQAFAYTGVLAVLLVAVATGTRALRSVRTL